MLSAPPSLACCSRRCLAGTIQQPAGAGHTQPRPATRPTPSRWPAVVLFASSAREAGQPTARSTLSRAAGDGCVIACHRAAPSLCTSASRRAAAPRRQARPVLQPAGRRHLAHAELRLRRAPAAARPQPPWPSPSPKPVAVDRHARNAAAHRMGVLGANAPGGRAATVPAPQGAVTATAAECRRRPGDAGGEGGGPPRHADAAGPRPGPRRRSGQEGGRGGTRRAATAARWPMGRLRALRSCELGR